MRKSANFPVNLAIFAYVAVMMMLCANSSPLYDTMNTDPAVFRVMGRAMTAGKVMYRDIFDHKGLYLYFINALGVLIDDKSLLGLFVIECVFMFLCARVVYALMLRFADRKTSLIGTQIFLAFAMFRGTFARGGMTENYALPFQLLAVYLLAEDGGKFSYLHMFLQGVLVGIVMCFKANLIMMWGGLAIVAGYELLRRGDFGRLAGNIAAGILGVIAGVMPAVVYAVRNDAVSDVAFGMFGYNFLYLNVAETGNFASVILRRMLGTLMPDGEIQVSAPAYAMVIFVAASCAVVVRRWGKSRLTAYYSAMLAMTVVSVALSGKNFGHYYESLVPFCIPAALWLASEVRPGRFRLAVVAVMVAGILAGVKIPDWVKELAGRKFMRMDEFVRMNEPYHTENERVLVTRNRAEFYDKLGVIPQEKYFYIPTNSYNDFPEPRDSQVASILSGVNDVIVVAYPKDGSGIFPETGRSSEIAKYLEANYDLLHSGKDNAGRYVMYGRKRR